MDMQRIRTRLSTLDHLSTYTYAVLVGAAIFVVQTYWVSGSEIPPFALAILGIGATLVFPVTVEGYHVAASRDGASWLDRLMADVVLSVSIMVPVTLALWSGMDASQQYFFALVCGVIVMTFVMQRHPRERPTQSVIDQYPEDPNYFSLPVWFLRLWPVFCLSFWSGLASSETTSDWDEFYLLYNLIFFSMLVQRLYPHRGFSLADFKQPSTVGLLLFFSVTFFAFSGYLPTRSA